MATTDAELLRASRRDARPFRELYDRYAERIESYHRRRSGSADAALDLTAETFARAWQKRAAFRDEAGGSAGPWLFAIARNVLLESVRRGRIEREACERLKLDRVPSGVEPEEAWLEGLDEALAELSEAQRAAVELRVVGELDYDIPRPSRRLALAVAAVALLVPAATVAAVSVIGGGEVAQTLEPGTAMLAGTHPTCTVVRPNVEYHCVLARAPVAEVRNADGSPALKGTVEPTVDATKHVNGGCRSQNDAGTVWQCYLGEEAVRQQIVSEGFLGAYAPSPGHG